MPRKKQPEAPPFRKAIERAVEIMGGVRTLARATEPILTHTTIRNFLSAVDRPPRPAHAIAVETATEGRVDRMEFYPEIMQGPLGQNVATILRKYEGKDKAVRALLEQLAVRGIRL